MINNVKQCSRCIMDSEDDPEIVFDRDNVCNYCHSFNDNILKSLHFEANKKAELLKIIGDVKKSRKNKYDSILGISGGTDSTYLAHKAVEYGLNPLVVHYDNGWNSELAVNNIENVMKSIGLDYYSHVNDWQEIKSLQRSFIKASVVDIELITDQAIVALLFKLARKHKIKYVITGHNHSTEGILPKHWYHWKVDVGNIEGINRQFGGIKLKTYPMMKFWERWYVDKYSGIIQVSPLNYLNYNKEDAKSILTAKYGWRDYGGKHFESIFTRFYQGYILPKKFRIDKRKAHLSTLICAGQMTREQALLELEKPVYDSLLIKEDRDFVLKKLEFTESEFNMLMKIPPMDHTDYPSYFNSYYRILKLLGKKVG